MAVRIQFRRGTAAEWTSANPTLATGEVGYETDNQQFKIGDGTTDWANLSYAAVSAGYVDNAIANVIDLAPSTLDTLNELAAAIGDDADFINTINSSISTAESNALAYTNSVANSVTTSVNGYTDNAIANLIDSSPGTLDTLNELAAALGDDANFSTTVTNSLANKISFVADTASNFDSSNPTLAANTFYVTTDTRRVKVGDGIGDWANATWLGEDFTLEHEALQTNVHGISNTQNLVYQADLSDFTAHLTDTTNVHGITDTANLVYLSALDNYATLDAANMSNTTFTGSVTLPADTAIGEVSATEISYLNNVSSAIQTQLDAKAPSANATLTGTVSLPATTSIGNVSDAEIGYIEGVTSPIQGQIDAKAESADPTLTGNVVLSSNTTIGNVTATEISYLEGVSSAIQSQIDTKAPTNSPTFTGTVALPSDTSIGNVSATEIAYLDNVSSNIQTQIDAKLASTTAATTYAPLANATLTGTVSLPADTSIGNVSATEIGYVDGVTSGIQSQLDAKLASATASSTYAPIDSPTFTTAATLPAQTTIGNVSATEIGYLDGVTSAIQTQLDAKAPIANATFTGDTEVVDITVTGNLIVQGTTTTVSTSDLSVKDNMIYLNQAGLSTLTDATGDGTNVVYTTSEAHGYSVGDFVTVANTNPSSFDITGAGSEILAVTDNTFTVASTVTDTYVSGGTARGKVHSNPDLGWAAGRYADNTYAHAGIFRDATDATFKFFDGYVPEPDESAFIDTSDNTFALAPLAVASVSAADFTASNAVIFADNTVQTSAGVPSITGFTEKTASYTLDTLDHQDNVVEMNDANAMTFTIPTNATLAWPVGASMDIIQTGTGQVTIANAVGVTLNYTPGNKLRTQWSSCTIMKRGTDSWIVYGDLTA